MLPGTRAGCTVTVTVAVAGPVLHSPAVGVTRTRTTSPVTNVLLVNVGPLATAALLTNQRNVGAVPALVGMAVKAKGVPGHCTGGGVNVTPVVSNVVTVIVTTLETSVAQVPVPDVTRRR